MGNSYDAFPVRVVELTNQTGFPRRVTVSSSTAIVRNVFLALTDDRTGIAVTAVGQACAGVTSMDKDATDDTSTSISCYTDCIVNAKASGAITVGNPIQLAGKDNLVMRSPLTVASGAAVIGYALKTAADDEVIPCRIRV